MTRTRPKKSDKAKAARSKAKEAGSKAKVKKRNRLDPNLRAQLMLKGAITYFAESGFTGQTRELAAKLGVSKGLLYRYFSDKEALIDRVYEEVFMRRWNPEWESILTDRDRPLIERLRTFYLDYAQLLRDYEWVRIYLFAGLAKASINRRYVKLVIDRVYIPVINEFRHEFGFPSVKEVKAREPELELMWNLHGALFYIGVRKWVYGIDVPSDPDSAVEHMVNGLYANAENVMRKTLSACR